MHDLMGLPLLASKHGVYVDNMIIYIHVLMYVLLIGWTVFFFYTLYRFSAKRNPKADYHGVQSHANSYVEYAVIIAEVVLLFGFSIPLWAEFVNDWPDEKDAVNIRVVAEQYAWNFHYPGPDGKFGNTKIELIDVQSNPLGLDRAGDPKAKDDVITKVLKLPVDKPIIAHISSKDVIHSLGIPAFRVKQDAIPGMTIPATWEVTKIGKYLIACSQLCGVGHSGMRGFIEVYSQAEFDDWMAERVQEALTEAEEGGDVW